jgi:CheY-like chemotaxis protein
VGPRISGLKSSDFEPSAIARQSSRSVLKMTETTQKTVSDSVEPSDSGTQFKKRKRILIADSDGFTRMVLMLLFRMIGFAVDFTANGTIAQHKLRSHPPDALLIELKLSGLSGLELIREARREAQYRKLRIYVFTDVEAMKRAIRKEVQLSATKVFDKRAISREDLVKAIVIDLAETEELLLRKAAARKAEAPPVRAKPAETLQPGDLDEVIEGVSEQSELVVKAQGNQERFANCRELLGRVCSLRNCAEAGGLRNLARQARALEAFIKQLCDEPRPCSTNSLNTITGAVELLGLLSCDEAGQEKELKQFTAVIIDESPSSSKALTEALSDAGINPSAFGNAARALEYLELNSVDVVLANVPLPELHGLELDKIRQLSLHAATSVIFVSEETASDPSKDPAYATATAFHRNPLLLRGIIMKVLNEVQRRLAGSARPPVGTRPVETPPSNQAELTAETAEAEPEVPPASSTEFLRAQQKLQPEDLFVPVPSHLPVMSAPEAEFADDPVVPLGSQAGSWIVEKTSETSEETTMMFAGTDPLAPEVNTLPSETPPGDAAAEVVAEPQADPSELSGNESTEETPAEPSAEVLHASVADSEAAARLDWAPESEGNAEAMSSTLESEASESQTVPDATAMQPSPEVHELVNEHLQALEGECAELRETVARHENDRELLVDRMLTSEGALHDAQVQLQEREQATTDLQKQLENLKQQQASSAGNEQRAQALEDELNHRTGEWERAKGEWEKQAADHGRVELELRRQLEEADVASNQDQAACQQAQSRAAELEQELGAVRQANEELKAKIAEEQKRAAEAADQKPASDLEQQISQRVAALSRVTADLAKERGERRRLEERAAALNLRLQELHAETRRLLESQRADQERLGKLEADVRERDEIITRRDADLEQQKAESLLAAEQLQRTRELNAQLRKDLSGFEAAHQKLNNTHKELQTQLAAALTELQNSGSKPNREPAERHRLEQALTDAQRDLETQSRKRETLETELQSTSQALRDAQSRLQQESAESQRLQEALDAAELQHRNQTQKAELETNQLQSALQLEQIERQRRETELARVRQTSLDAARGTRLLRNTLRRQIREPVDNLYLSTRNLLQLELGPDQKKLAEAILQDTLLVHTRLQEPGVAPGEENVAPAHPDQGASGQNTVAPDPKGRKLNKNT